VTRDRVGRFLLFVCALAAATASVFDIGTVMHAPPGTQAVETWRMVALALFAGLFALLALAPRQLRGMFELVMAAKVALPVCGATFLHGVPGAQEFIVVDGTLAVVLVIAYVLLAGWEATPARPASTPRKVRR